MIFEGDEGKSYGSAALPGDLTIPSNKTLTVPEGGSLTIPEGVTLTNEGKAQNEGKIINNGKIVNWGTFENTGTLVNNGTIEGLIDGSGFRVMVQTEGGGTASASPETAVVGTEVTLTATANGGWHFKEWQVVSGGVTITDGKFIMPAGSVTVKAIFEEDRKLTSYTIVFNSQGGSNVPSVTVTSGETLSAPSDPTRSGYNFGGWYKESACTTAWHFDTDTVTGNMTLYAKWTAKPTSGGGGGTYTPPTYPPRWRNPARAAP